jgi:hypothetical protein
MSEEYLFDNSKEDEEQLFDDLEEDKNNSNIIKSMSTRPWTEGLITGYYIISSTSAAYL